MRDNQCRKIGPLGRPTTMGESSRAGFDFEQPHLVSILVAPGNPAGPEMRANGLRVALTENPMRHKRFPVEFPLNVFEQSAYIGGTYAAPWSSFILFG